ncbi:hypothetical protein HDF13_002792 [Edaphobacter lichenicola]|uniref:Uncharacterized protein n=1 Tax=Tunturiibacter gelidiferens TaxID=3069689 RepID=A0ACC5P0T3_9BACT|nr:hypothetical protein [Edaphobacter lichenicola]
MHPKKQPFRGTKLPNYRQASCYLGAPMPRGFPLGNQANNHGY